MRPPGEIFESASDRDLQVALQYWQQGTFECAETIMEKGDRDPALIYVLDGRVEIVRDEVVIDVSGVGELIGEMAFFTGMPRVATVRAAEDCHVLVLDREGYDALREKGNEVAYSLERLSLKLLGRRLRRLDRLVAERSQGEASPYYKPPPSVFARIRGLFAGDSGPEVAQRPLDPVDVLEHSPLFAGERHMLLKVIASYVKQETYAKGDFLCSQGEPGHAIYILGEGTVDVVVAKAGEDIDPSNAALIDRLGVLRPGSAFGLTALADGRPRMASCVAREQVDVLTLDRETYLKLVEESNRAGSTMRLAMIRAFSAQVDEAGAALVKAVTGEAAGAALRAGARLEHTGSDESNQDWFKSKG